MCNGVDIVSCKWYVEVSFVHAWIVYIYTAFWNECMLHSLQNRTLWNSRTIFVCLFRLMYLRSTSFLRFIPSSKFFENLAMFELLLLQAFIHPCGMNWILFDIAYTSRFLYNRNSSLLYSNRHFFHFPIHIIWIMLFGLLLLLLEFHYISLYSLLLYL